MQKRHKCHCIAVVVNLTLSHLKHIEKEISDVFVERQSGKASVEIGCVETGHQIFTTGCNHLFVAKKEMPSASR